MPQAEKKTLVKVDKVFNKKEAHQISRAQEKELKKLTNKRSKIEAEIADLELQITEIDLALAQNYEEVSARPDFFEKYKQKKKSLDSLMEDWEKLETTISNFS